MSLEPKKYLKLWSQVKSKEARVPRKLLASEERLQAYFDFLTEAKALILKLKGNFSRNSYDAAQACHQRALRLGLIRSC